MGPEEVTARANEAGEGPPTLAAAITRHREELIDRWAAQAEKAASARGLTQPDLRNLLPRYLAAIGAGSSAPEDLDEYVESHLAGRLRQGFDLPEMIEEFLLLESCANSLWISLPELERPADAERQRFSAIIQGSILRITGLFDEHMREDEQHEKRYLRLLQSIADDALRTPDAPLTSRLDEVLALFLEATGASAASLFLDEMKNEQLRRVASAGLAGTELEEFASSLAPHSLDGEVASKVEPTLIADLETTEHSVSDSLRHSGIHALVGIRLPPRRQLIGLLYLGLRDKRRFTAREVRRLEALADRLTLHLENASLYADLHRHIQELDVERELRERFVAILAHDLRGPLSTTKLSAQILLSDTPTASAQREVLERLLRNVERMERMIRDLLDISRVRAGELLPLRLDWCDLGALAHDVSEELSRLYGERFELAVPQRVRGIWSQEELRRALWNLAVNAVKYGDPETPITTRVEQTATGARVSIHNFGPSIEPAQQAVLFDAFTRLKATSLAKTGWGLGLALVRACADAHGGEVGVHSTAEAGTTFSISLPADSREFRPDLSAEQPSPAPTPTHSGPP